MKKDAALTKMILLATSAHEGQTDRAGKPYILHPLEVMAKLESDDAELLCIALGHDLVEDTWVTLEYLQKEGFSARIVEGIRLLTKDPGQSREEYFEDIKTSPDAIRVKMADLSHNADLGRLHKIKDGDIARRDRYLKEHAELVEALHDRFKNDLKEPVPWLP